MKTKRFSHLCTVLVLVLLASLAIGRGPASRAADASRPQGQTGTVFTYQGQLRDGNGPVNGICDLRFTLWDAAEGGSQLGSPLTLEAIELKDGLFTARLDFGAAAFRGQVRWLAVAASCPTGGAYVDLAPR
jgi:hypothetical protein